VIMNANSTSNSGPLLVSILSMGRGMKNKSQIMQEVDGQRILK